MAQSRRRSAAQSLKSWVTPAGKGLRSPAFGFKLKKTTSGGEPKRTARVFPLGGEAHAAHIPAAGAARDCLRRCSRFPRRRSMRNALATQAFAVRLASGGVCIVTRGHLLIIFAIICLFFEC